MENHFADASRGNASNLENARYEPSEIAPKSSLLRPNPPKGTGFNRRTVAALLTTVGIIFTLGILYAFTPAQKHDEALETMGSFEREMGRNSPGHINTPDIISNIPDTYMNSRQLPPNTLTPGIPLDMARMPELPEYEVEKYVPHQFQLPEFIEDSPEEQERKELAEARKSSIRFASTQRNAASGRRFETEDNEYLSEAETVILEKGEEQNGATPTEEITGAQDEKRKFLEKPSEFSFYAGSSLKKPHSKYEVKASTVVPAVLITGISSDLPGYMSAQVRENVYDSVTGRYLLIPQGTRLIGIYDSKVNFGQKRVLVVWTRMIFPNGKSINLENMPGIGQNGKNGLRDRVNNHWGRIVSGAIITSIFSAAANIQANDDNDELLTDKEMAAQGFGDSMVDFGSKLTDKNLSIQPTLEIRPGFKFNLFVHKDFILEPYRD